jgi:hypothetical protein
MNAEGFYWQTRLLLLISLFCQISNLGILCKADRLSYQYASVIVCPRRFRG